MDKGGGRTCSPFIRAVNQFKHTGGHTDELGNILGKPHTLVVYELIDNLCQKYGVTPSQIMDENASLVLQMNHLISISKPDEEKYGE